MQVLHDPGTLAHDTVELLGAKLIPALESPERILALLEALETSEHTVHLIGYEERLGGELAETLRATHDLGYLNHLRDCHGEWLAAGHISKHESILPECFPTFKVPGSAMTKTDNDTIQPPKDIFARSGYYAFDMSTGIMGSTYDAAICSANLALHAVSLIMSYSGPKVAMALCRPPGHHCDTTKAGGYCYLNNCVVAVESIIRNARRFGNGTSDNEIVVLDLDFHHGNGTQSFFYDRKVRYISIHGEDEYPYYTGNPSECGTGAGLGYNHNFPLPQKSSLEEYLLTLKRALGLALSSSTRFLVLSLGFDTFALDPLGSFNLQTDDYFTIARYISLSLHDMPVKAVILLEGGYVIENLGANLVAFLDGWQATSDDQGCAP